MGSPNLLPSYTLFNIFRQTARSSAFTSAFSTEIPLNSKSFYSKRNHFDPFRLSVWSISFAGSPSLSRIKWPNHRSLFSVNIASMVVIFVILNTSCFEAWSTSLCKKPGHLCILETVFCARHDNSTLQWRMLDDQTTGPQKTRGLPFQMPKENLKNAQMFGFFTQRS